jgi:hypothetical protein
MFAEKLEKYVNEGKALNEARNEHKKVPGLSRAGGGGGAGGDFSGMKGLDKPFKAGGKVKSASATSRWLLLFVEGLEHESQSWNGRN